MGSKSAPNSAHDSRPSACRGSEGVVHGSKRHLDPCAPVGHPARGVRPPRSGYPSETDRGTGLDETEPLACVPSSKPLQQLMGCFSRRRVDGTRPITGSREPTETDAAEGEPFL